MTLQSKKNENVIIALLMIAAVAVSGLLGYYIATATPASPTGSAKSNVVNLEIVPDFGGSGYDAFVLSTSLENGAVPAPASNNTAPGVSDNNITVSSGTTVTFVNLLPSTQLLIKTSAASSRLHLRSTTIPTAA